MADVFISYSRADSAYVQRLGAGLRSRGKDVWVDVDGIRDAELFPLALRRAIETSDAFVFVISPEAVRSPFCEQEVAHARELNKRIVPLALRPVSDEELPGEIRFRNWIPATDDGEFESTLERLIVALGADLEWEHQHTRLTVKALEWDQAGRDRSFLLRGSELASAERWLAAGAGKAPGATALEQEYLLAARLVASRRQRLLVGISVVVAVVSVALVVFALISRGQAVTSQTVAKSGELAAESQNELTANPEVSILLAVQAVRRSATPPALYALREAIDRSPVIGRLPSRGPQPCDQGVPPGANAPPSIGYSPSGALIAEAACDGRVLIDGAGGARARWNLRSPAGPVAFSPNGQMLAVSTEAGVSLLDVATGQVRETFDLESEATTPPGSGEPWPGESPVCVPQGSLPEQLKFSPSGRQLAAVYHSNLDLWQLNGSAQPREVGGARGCIQSMDFDPSGASLLVTDDRSVERIDVATGSVRARRTLLAPTVDSPSQPPILSGISVSPSGRVVAVAAIEQSNTGIVKLYDPRTWTRLATLVQRPAVPLTNIVFSPDGTRLAIGGLDGSAGIWSVASHRELLPLNSATVPISSIAWRPDSGQIATTSSDGEGRLWRTSLDQGSTISTGVGLNLDEAVVSADRVWAGITEPQAEILRSWTREGRPASRPFRVVADPSGIALAFSGNGRLAAATRSGEDIIVRDLAHGHTVGSVSGFTTSGIIGLALDTSGDRLLAASATSGIGLFDVKDGMRLLAAQTLPNSQTCAGGYVSFSADGQRAVGVNYCGQGIFWNTRTGKLLGRFDTGVQSVSAISLDTHGRLLALSSWSRTTTIYQLDARRALRVLIGDTASVTDVAFSPQGTWLATASEDGDVRIWDVANGQLLRLVPDNSGVFSVAFSSNGADVVFTDSDGQIHIQDACSLCGNARGLLRLAASRVTQQLTAAERREYGA